MTGAVAGAVTFVLYALIACLVIRALLSWFPQASGEGRLVRILDRVTAPLLEPVRRWVPPLGMIDISSLLVILLLTVMLTVVEQAARYSSGG